MPVPNVTPVINSLLKNAFEAADARQKRAKKRSLHVVCRFATPHFEPVFNAAAATQIVFQQAVKLCTALLTTLWLLAGCVTAVATFNPEPTSATDAIVYIYRPDTLANILVTPPVIMDGTAVFSILNNQYHTLHLPPGPHRIKLDLADRYLGDHEITIDAANGQSYFLRIDTSLRHTQNRPYDRRFDIRHIVESEALTEIARCKPATSDSVQSVAAPAATKTPGYSSEIFRNPCSH